MNHGLTTRPELNQAQESATETLDTLFAVGQIRLAELSVYNWGSFNGLHTARFDPEGTLVTGDNGAGKTTLIDGLMALLMPSGRVAFNVAAAQGDRTDRTLLSYMRGSFGSAHDGSATRVRSKREAGVVSGLRALYRADDGSEFTLCVLFWTTQASNALSDVKRCYAIARRDLSLKELLEAFGEGSARALKQWLKADPSITCCDENFREYQSLYRQLLYMENKNAPSLLSRALGLKRIDDLTALIRELVLEPSTVRDDARLVVTEFADLVGIHDKLVDARRQRDALERLPELDEAIRKASDAITGLSEERIALPVYLAKLALALWEQRVNELTQALESVEQALAEQERQSEVLTEQVERYHEAYLQLGGDQVEIVKKELVRAKETLSRIVRVAASYQQNASALNLPETLNETVFKSNQAQANAKLETIQQDTERCQDQFGQVSAQMSELQIALRENREQAKEIASRPDSNIDLRFQQLRDRLVESLSLDASQCRFIGELMDVQDTEHAWQGAVERALGGLRTTLAVPESSFRMITRWLNSQHTGLHVRVQVVTTDRVPTSPPEFLHNGFLRKLTWREHPYRDWLKHHLKRFDLQCVNDLAELDDTPFSMTREGLIHKEKGRFEKKDLSRIDDRRQWYLGFSNTARLALLETDFRGLQEREAVARNSVAEAREALDAMSTTKHLWESIRDARWDDIDVPHWEAQTASLAESLGILERATGDLAQARQRWEAAKEGLRESQAALNDLNAKRGAARQSLSQAISQRDQTAAQAAQPPDETLRVRLDRRLNKHFGTLGKADLQRMGDCQRTLEASIDEQLGTERGRLRRAESGATGVMSTFRANEKWKVFAVDWGADLNSLPEYLAHLNTLLREGLPALVESFGERLNKHATQSLARIMTRLESEREDIVERIDTINHVLRRTEFKPGSHLKLGTRKDRYAHVQDFERKLHHVLSQINSDDHDARFHDLAEVVEILDQASSPGSVRSNWSLQLLDPRHQMSFFAEELDSDTLQVRDVLESSSGKSGGEKEAFAGTIVAASLAYVLTPDGANRPVYSTVFLDEAFSNTAEMVSRRVLRVFRELQIHVNLITPYKNLNLARESANSLLIAERDPDNHDSHLSEVTWTEIDERLEAERARATAEQADALGIEVD